MAVLALCGCGQRYELKDDYAGQLVQCPSCGGEIRAGGSVADQPWRADPAFNRNKFLLRQKHFSVSERYSVWDEHGQTLLYVVRPAHLGRRLFGAMFGVATAVAIVLLLGMVLNAASLGPDAGAILMLITLPVAAIAGIVVGSAMGKERHISFYRDETEQEQVLEVRQDQLVVLARATFSLVDPAGSLLGRFEKRYIYNLFRKQWNFLSPEGALLYVAKEDSILLSLLRRVLGSFFGLLRTNYVILDAQGRLLGQFNRKLTLMDRYVLDMSHDPTHAMDRRVALALGVLLDTGEKR